MIRLRIDVDYPYPSRIKSFIFVLLGINVSKDYLKNPKAIARMINASTAFVKAYWFFTVRTIPDAELMNLLDNDKHEIALHVVNDPRVELRVLERATGKRIKYYTIHGAARLLAKIVWRQSRLKATKMPADFPLRSFHQFPTKGIDSLCYSYPIEHAKRIVIESVRNGSVIYFHPIWLFQRGKLNRRGPFYEVLRWLLNV